MNMEAIWKKYNMDDGEKVPFAKFIQSSPYKYTKSFWSGINIDDSQDIDAIVNEFRRGYIKRFIPVSEFSSAVPNTTQSKLMDCPDCGKQVSRRAQVCIHCGCPLSSVSETAQLQFYGVKTISTMGVWGNPSTYLSRVRVMNDQATKINDLSILACGITRDRAELLLKYLVEHGGEGELVVDTQCTQENEQVTQLIDSTINPNAPVVCPRCRSTDVVVGQRGYNVVSGFVGSSKTTNRCGKCGHTWNPGALMK